MRKDEPRSNSVKNTLTMSLTVNLPVPKTIAFGGVATGNINANEAQTVAGIIKYKGLTPILCA